MTFHMPPLHINYGSSISAESNRSIFFYQRKDLVEIEFNQYNVPYPGNSSHGGPTSAHTRVIGINLRTLSWLWPRVWASSLIARWILDKLELVRALADEDIVTGSRIPYLGRKYYTEVYLNQQLEQAEIEFNQSRFRIHVNPAMEVQPAIRAAVDSWHRERALEKITPRVKKLARQTGLAYQQLKFQKMEKRWGSCTESNNIIRNTEAVKLPFTLIDYIIIYELCHARVKNHSKEFWAELSRHIPNWKELDEKVAGMKL